MNTERRQYRCTNCRNVHPEWVTEPFDEVKTICGTRWDGCGDVHKHVLVRDE